MVGAAVFGLDGLYPKFLPFVSYARNAGESVFWAKSLLGNFTLNKIIPSNIAKAISA